MCCRSTLLRESFCSHVHKRSSIVTMLQLKIACSFSLKSLRRMSLEFIWHHTSWLQELSAFFWVCVKGSKCWATSSPQKVFFLQTVPELESSQHVLLSGGQHHTVSPGPPSQSRGGWGELGDIPVRDLAGLHLLFPHWLHQEFSHAFSAFYSFWSAAWFWWNCEDC